MGKMSVIQWKERGRKKRYPVLTDFIFPASAICPWSGNHKLDVSQPLAGIQLLQSSPSTPHDFSILQVEGGAVYSFITHMAERSADFLNQKITLSFFSNC